MNSGGQSISATDFRAQQFSSWERRGRGLSLWDARVNLEPPFVPFNGHRLPAAFFIDDGREPTVFSSLADRIKGFIGRGERANTREEPELAEPEPRYVTALPDLVEIQTALPADFPVSREAFEQLLSNLTYCRGPLCFEMLGLPDQIIAQFAVQTADAATVTRQLAASFPEAVCTRQERVLEQAWNGSNASETAIVEFALEREFMFPIATIRNFNQDPLTGLAGALSELHPGELGLFQVLFQPVSNPWVASMVSSVSDQEGKPCFLDAPELLDGARNKATHPLYAVLVRIATRGEDWERTWNIARELASAMRVFADPQGNEFTPLPNNSYGFTEHAEDVIRRQTRRSGMLLSRDELISLVHLPSACVRSPKLKREVRKTKAAPRLTTAGILLGCNLHAGQSQPVYLNTDQRVRHLHLIGASGTGKSTLLFNLIVQDIQKGEGVALLDPHGDLIDRILGVIPPQRIDDVVLVDPSDEQFSVGFNFLSAHSDLEKTLLASDLVSVFQRLSTSWGDQMGSVLQNAILAFLESSQGGTLSDLRRFLIEPKFREQFLKTVRDPDIVYYWRKGFAQLSGNKSIGPVLTRLETFLSPKPIRYMVAQGKNRLDFADIIDTGKIFLAKLPQGQMGKENSFLLGSLFVAKFQQLVMGRQAQRIESRRPFYLYIDEFQNFITPSMAEILSGARKYRLGLILAHQELRQLERDREVASAVLSNPYSRVVFRVGDADARTLGSGFANFQARDLLNLGTGEAVCRVEKADGDFNLRVQLPQEPDADEAEATRQAVITASRKRYATPRAEIEAALLARLDAEETESRPVKARPTPAPVPKASEAPKVTVSEIKPAPVAALAVRAPEVAPTTPEHAEEPKPAVPPPDLGRGGAQHKAIQKRVKEAAETLGFRSVIEHEVLDGKGSVDLLLVRDGQSIACEISLTTSVDHEVGNVAKCLKAGFPTVAVICLSDDRLEKIQSAVVGSLGTEATAGVVFFQPDQFITHLQTLLPQTPEVPGAPKIRKGYKVKHQVAKLSPEERREREGAAIHSIKEAMQRRAKE